MCFKFGLTWFLAVKQWSGLTWLSLKHLALKQAQAPAERMGGLRFMVRGRARQRLWLRGPHAAARHPWSGSKGFAQQLGFLEMFSEPRISAPFEKMAMGPPFISS